MQLFEEEMS